MAFMTSSMHVALVLAHTLPPVSMSSFCALLLLYGMLQGKTALINEVRRRMRERYGLFFHEKFLLVAPTGIAAMNANGKWRPVVCSPCHVYGIRIFSDCSLARVYWLVLCQTGCQNCQMSDILLANLAAAHMHATVRMLAGTTFHSAFKLGPIQWKKEWGHLHWNTAIRVEVVVMVCMSACFEFHDAVACVAHAGCAAMCATVHCHQRDLGPIRL